MRHYSKAMPYAIGRFLSHQDVVPGFGIEDWVPHRHLCQQHLFHLCISYPPHVTVIFGHDKAEGIEEKTRDELPEPTLEHNVA